MAEPFTFLGWAFRWHSHASGSRKILNQNRPRFTDDFQKVREIMYDEWAQYAFSFRVRRINPRVHLFIRGELLLDKGSTPVLMSGISADTNVDPEEPWQEFAKDPAHTETKDDYQALLFWPAQKKEYHAYGTTRKFQVRIGWKKRGEPGIIPPVFAPPLPPISVFVSDVIPKDTTRHS
ncbi:MULTISPECIES: hypothetical protein [unclassified Methanoregula]|uniref:hypothetical protein n=1 Tax=unclassified Methanoregula TaxID=2649730 RepID=UPI0025CD6C94|nr:MULTISPECIES: hypothetical protein [unclassified Methanoregula]